MNIKGANGIMKIQPRPGRSRETPRIIVASDLPVFPIYHLVMTNIAMENHHVFVGNQATISQ